MKRCGVCGAPYRGKGRRVIAGGAFRRGCPACASKAVLVAQSAPLARCSCGGEALLCGACCTRTVTGARAEGLEPFVRVLRARLEAFQRTTPKPEEKDYVEGVIDGLERAIDTLHGARV